MKKLLAWLLIITLCIGQAGALEDVPGNIKEQVVSNFDRSFTESDYFTELMVHPFPYMEWIENLENQSAEEKLWRYVTDLMMDTTVRRDDYLDCLMTLMIMVDQGTMQSVALQEQFSGSADGASDMTEAALSLFFVDDPDSFKELESASKLLFSTFDLADVTVEGMQQCRALNTASITYQNQHAILSGIISHTNIADLKKAAQEVLDICTYQYCFVFSDGIKATGSTLMAALKNEEDIVRISDSIRKWTKDNFTNWLRSNKSIRKLVDVDKLIVNAGKFANKLSYFTVGMEIGAALMKMIAGDMMNCGKEMRAMADVAEALKDAFDDARATASHGSITARYHAVCEYVSIGQALVIAHLRAQYCDIQARKLFGASDEHTIYYNSVLAPMLAGCSDVLASILSEFESDVNDLTRADAAYLVLARRTGDTLYGYVDLRTGEMEISPQFTSGDRDFGANELAIVSDRNSRCNVINQKGQKLFKDGEIDSAMEFYNGECLVVQKDKVHCYLYDADSGELTELKVPAADAVELKPEQAVYTSTYNRRRAGYVPERYIHLRATNAAAESTDYWLNEKGEILYTATGDKCWGCLAGDEGGYYYFYSDKGTSVADCLSPDLTLIQTKRLGMGSYIPAVNWDGDCWYARSYRCVWTNLMQRFAEPVYLSGALDLDANDGVISTGGYYYASDGRELVSNYTEQSFYYRNGYIKWANGFGDRNGNVLYPFPEGTQRSDFSIVLPDGYYIQRESGLLGIKNLDGTVVCPAAFAELRDMK